MDEVNLLDWDVTMMGPPETPWEGKICEVVATIVFSSRKALVVL